MTKTSPLMICNNLGKPFLNKKGFTLIEIMIVLAIFAAVVAVGLPKLFKNPDNIKSVARQFIVLSKSVRDKARMTNSTYRIVIHLKPKEDSYWVERANGSQLIDPEMMTSEGRKRVEELAKDNAKDNAKDKEKAPPPLFQIDKSVLKKEKTLPNGMRFTSLETVNTKQPITEGDAYIYFFPEGFVEAAALQITYGANVTWTLVFNPLTGQADIVPKAQSLKDIQR